MIAKNKIVLDCFTDRSEVYELARVDRATKFLPDWWKALPNVDSNAFIPEPNAKYCVGLINSFANSLALPLWSDLHIDVAPEGDPSFRWQFSDGASNLQSHDYSQWAGFVPPEKYLHLKLIGPWRIKTKSDVQFFWSEPTWNLLTSTNIRVLPGVIDYKNNTATNVNIMVERTDKPTHVRLKFGTPIAFITPMTDKKVELRHHLVSSKEMDDLAGAAQRRISFLRSSKIAKQVREANHKCPFRRP